MPKRRPKRKSDNPVEIPSGLGVHREEKSVLERTRKIHNWPYPVDDLSMVNFGSSEHKFADEADAWVQRYLDLADIALSSDREDEDERSDSKAA